jgi:hypothetical protein
MQQPRGEGSGLRLIFVMGQAGFLTVFWGVLGERRDKGLSHLL